MEKKKCNLIFYNVYVWLPQVICLALGRGTLMRILGDQVQVIATRNLQKWAFERSAILSKLTKIQIERILDQMKTRSFKQGELVLKKGTKASEKLFIIMEGELIFVI
jgi:cGMP-dependent protein kinase 1